MNSDKNYAELDQLIIGMKEAADSEGAKINSRCREINARLPILMEQMQQLAEEHQQPRMDVSSDTNSRLADILSKGMSYEELARYAAEGWSWASLMEDAYEKLNTLQSLKEEAEILRDEIDQLESRRTEIISTFGRVEQSIGHKREVLELAINAYEDKKNTVKGVKEGYRKPRSDGGKSRHKKSVFPAIEEKVKKEWNGWPNKSRHGAKTAFAKKMMLKHKEVTSMETITGWIRKWEKESSAISTKW